MFPKIEETKEELIGKVISLKSKKNNKVEKFCEELENEEDRISDCEEHYDDI